MSTAEGMGWCRAALGTVLIALPRAVLGVSSREPVTPAAVLLLRTIGIRDLVLGAGAVAGARSGGAEARRWTTVALASDAMDVAASLASRRSLGTRGSVAAAGLAAAAVIGDVLTLRPRR